jgi:hypothetical protein
MTIYIAELTGDGDNLIIRIGYIQTNINWVVICAISLCLLLPAELLGIGILFDDLSDIHDPEEAWSYQFDTLATYGVEIHYTSNENWSNIMDMEMVWIQSPHPDSIYSDEEVSLFQAYVRNGGKILIGIAKDYGPGLMEPYNRLLGDTGWQTTMGLFNLPDYCTYGEFQTVAIGSLFAELPPITNSVNTARFFAPAGISCGYNAFPFAFAQNYYDRPVTAISFPFFEEGNCSSYVILVSGNHEWENVSVAYAESTDTYIFARNILLTMAGVPGYEFDPCAFAESVLVPEIETVSLCQRTPNPFTPNGDGINDEVEFEFPGLSEVEGVIKIFTLGNLRVRTIEVPAGWSAKETAVWDGTDNAGAPLREGIYLYIIRSEGRIKCKGTVTLAR